MGESIMDSSEFEDKKQTAEMASSNTALEVSVSFGRFQNDSLSWERFSTFSPNKYLEEVGKCATPGSVAEKKAYFEAHYKKIAAQKAELMDQEKQIENYNLMDQNSETDFHYGTFIDSAEAFEETNLVSEVSSDHIDEANGDGDALITIECQSLTIGVMEELDGRLDSPKLNKSDDFDMVREEIQVVRANESKEAEELPQNLESETRNFTKTEDENVKSDLPKASQKTMKVNKGKDTPVVKKKPTKTQQVSTPRVLKPAPTKTQQVSTPRVLKPAPTKDQQVSTPKVLKPAPIKAQQVSIPKVLKPAPTRTPQFSTPRVSKPAPTPNSMTTSRSSMKKENGTSVPRKKSTSVGEGKRVTPKSLHMSISIDPPTPVHSDPASLTTTRKSLIMERMGDKDIVKRAFKMFQNNFNQLRSLSEERSPVLEQASTEGTDVVKVSGTMNMHRDNGGSIRANGTEKRSAKAAPSSLGLKDGTVPKQTEFLKKLEGKSNTQVERTRVRPKSKEQKDAKKLTQSLDLKGSPMSGLYRRKKISTCPAH